MHWHWQHLVKVMEKINFIFIIYKLSYFYSTFQKQKLQGALQIIGQRIFSPF